ncbi:hypothetical protein [Lachnotalea glycerini]|uniref:hypothetical protein n=1 Tax=Lachnotalea glycerini TaxID=1763509 RepID=UPI0014750FEF|nr:hypothetical protein [Lachnotalea glycerini]
MANGNEVQAAGMMKVNSKGYVRCISGESGHYQPTVAQIKNYPQVIENIGVNTDGSWIRISEFETSMSNYVIDSHVVYNGPIKYMPQ